MFWIQTEMVVADIGNVPNATELLQTGYFHIMWMSPQGRRKGGKEDLGWTWELRHQSHPGTC